MVSISLNQVREPAKPAAESLRSIKPRRSEATPLPLGTAVIALLAGALDVLPCAEVLRARAGEVGRSTDKRARGLPVCPTCESLSDATLSAAAVDEASYKTLELRLLDDAPSSEGRDATRSAAAVADDCLSAASISVRIELRTFSTNCGRVMRRS